MGWQKKILVLLGQHKEDEVSQILNCKNDFELAVRATKRLETELTAHFKSPEFSSSPSPANDDQQTFSSLHDKITAARFNNQPLPLDLQKQMRFVVSVRNQIVHRPEFNEIPERQRFVEALRQIEDRLAKFKEAQKPKQEEPSSSGCCVM